MSINLPASVQTEIGKTYTKATWLIELEAGTEFAKSWIRVTTGKSVWDGVHIWDGSSGCSVEGAVSKDRFSFSLPNQSGEIFSMAANNELGKWAEVNIWVKYLGSDAQLSDAVHFMRGAISSVSGLMSDRATITVDRHADENMVVPTRLIAPPDFSMLPPRDLVIEWGGARFITVTFG